MTPRCSLWSWKAALAAAVLALVVSACGGDQCLRHSDCASQLVCSSAGQCEWPPQPDATPTEDNSEPIRELPDGALDDSELGEPSDAGVVPDAEDGI